MSMNVRGPGETQQPPATPAGPVAGPEAKPMISGAQAVKNAEAAFDNLFHGDAPVTISQVLSLGGGMIAKDALATPEAKQAILTIFTHLKSEFLKEKPAGETADAFAHPATQFAGELPKREVLDGEVASLRMNVMAASDSKVTMNAGVLEGLSVVQDRVTMKQMAAVEDKWQIAKAEPWYKQVVAASSHPQMKKAEPQWAAVTQWIFGSVQGGRGDKKAPGSADNRSADASSGAKKGSSKAPAGSNAKEPEPAAFGGLANAISGSFRITADMDVSSLLIIIMMTLSKDAEEDLRDMMSQMQATMKLKDAKRQMMRALEDEMRSLKTNAQEQLDSLKEQGKVAKDVTIDEFLDACNVSMQPPSLNEETGEWEVYPAKLKVPNPIPESLREEKVVQDKETGEMRISKVGAGLGQAVNWGAGNKTKQDKGDPDEQNDPGGGNRQRAGENQPDTGNRQNTGGWMSTKEAQARAMEAKHGGGKGGRDAGGERQTITFGDMQAGIDGLKDDLDAMGSQSEMDQMRLQMYMDRRAKAIETLSTSLKKISETGASIVKNMA